MFFLGILSIQCKVRRDQPSDTRRSIGRFQRLKATFFGSNFEILPKVSYSQPLLKDV